MIFESHAHYDDDTFDTDREQLLDSLADNGIGYVVNCAASLDSVKSTLALARRYPFIYGALGVHPSDASTLNEDNIAWLKKMLACPEAVAVGEIGLDYYWEKEEETQSCQRLWFARQLSLAKELDKPVIIHSRDAARDTRDVMEAQGAADMRGVIHCFSYTKEMAREFLKWNFYFGIGGVITFKNARKLKEAVEYIPLSNLLLETDCPWLSPEPYRGKRNSSLYLPMVAQAVADVKGISYDEVTETTCANAKRLFGIQ